MIFRTVISIILIHCILSTATAWGQQASFDRANQLMEDQQIEEALELYRSIENNGHYSGELFFNMGLAALYSDSLGLAKYYFMKSSRFNQTKPSAQQALQYVNEQFERRSAVLPPLPWVRFFNWLNQIAGVQNVFIISVLLLNIAVGAIISSWFTVELKWWLQLTGKLLILVSLLFFSISAYLAYHENRYSEAVLVEDQASVFERPVSTSSLVNTAYEGYTMTVDRKISADQDNWYYIRLQNGMYGWVRNDQVKVLR